jgi:hypothetical protein
VLNTTEGGYSRHYQPDDIDGQVFATLQTDTLRSLRYYTEPFRNYQAIDRYARLAQEYAAENPVTTKQKICPIFDDIRHMIRQQALPSVARGTQYSIMVTTGSDLTLEACASKKSFYKGGGPSPEMAIEIFDNTAKCERGHTTTATNFVSDMCDNGHLPFVDVFPWVNKDDVDLPFALQNLRSYLEATSPMIVLTLSNNVSKIAMGSFHRLRYFRVQTYGLADIAGIPTITKYDENQLDADDNNCCIAIPSLHPGSVKHSTARGKIIIKIIWRTSAIAWLVMNECIKLSQLTNPVLTKREILALVVEKIAEKTGPGSKFGDNFEALKQTLRDHHTECYSQLTRRTRLRIQGDIPVIQIKSIRWRKAMAELYELVDCDFARGKRDSAERQNQAERLFDFAYYLRTARTGVTDDEYRSWCHRVVERQSFYFAAVSASDSVEDFPNLLSLFLQNSSIADSEDWESDAALVDQCYNDLRL